MEMPRKRGRPKILRPEPEKVEERRKLDRESKMRAKLNLDLHAEEAQKNNETRRLTRSQMESPLKEPEKIVEELPKKKRYSYGRRKSSNATIVIDDDAAPKSTLFSKVNGETLLMECWSEDIVSEQVEYYNKIEKEYAEVMDKFETLAKKSSGETIHSGDTCVGIQYTETVVSTAPVTTTTTTAPATTSAVVIQQKQQAVPAPGTYQIVMDPRLGMIVGTITPTAQTVVTAANTPAATTVTTVNTQIRAPPKKSMRGRPSTASTTSVLNNPPPLQPVLPYGVQSQPSTSTSTQQIRPTESTAAGGLLIGTKSTKVIPQSGIVDLTTDDGRPPADSREVAFNKLQGKTFPSLVVVARPHLRAKEAAMTNDRNSLDLKVKSVLIHTPTKFTEWLIQQGLVRSEQSCLIHNSTKLNLGMYSDVSKFPYSGGYVWISECCPHRFVSVFSGSLFEGAVHAPTIILKLMYHWACQTNIQNIVQWVKVENLYVKGLFTWLRAACTFALQQHLKPLGGMGKRIEVGVISLGTTSQDGSQRQVKVEVLGVLDPEARLIRLRAVEPLADGERNYRRRFSKILEPLRAWVHTDSIISTDLTVDKGTLHMMGFNNVIQNTSSNIASNQTVMEYLRKIVPRMFQNTLSLLSRQIIQQFLDELVWREWFGETAAQAFNSIVQHLAEQTRMNTNDSLIQRLNKVAANPFKNHWLIYQSSNAQKPESKLSSTQSSTISPSPTVVRRYGRKRTAPIPSAAVIDLEKPKRQALYHSAIVIDNQDFYRKDTAENMVPLESYYYGNMQGDMNNPLAQSVTLNLKCCVCKVSFVNNIQLLDHLLAHAHNVSAKNAVRQCRYCLAISPTVDELNSHISDVHPIDTRSVDLPSLACLICETRCGNSVILGNHMSNIHVPQEMPYICGTCGFRSSSHRTVIDHYYSIHNGATTLQCPFCLKSMAIWSSAGRVMSTSVTFFFNHIQKHQKKSVARKCNKCSLWFYQKEILKEHQAKAHTSMVGKKGVKIWTLPPNYLTVPRSRLVKHASPEKLATNNSSLTVSLPIDVKCKECFTIVKDIDHFPQKFNCNSCQYSTDCHLASQRHKLKCRKLSTSPAPRLKLDAELHCICGYSIDDGNQIAKHLALCERKTAYSTPEKAQAATVPHSMLDVLGLMRRNDDTQQNGSEEDVSEDKGLPTESLDVEMIEDIDEEVHKLEPKMELVDTEITTIDD